MAATEQNGTAPVDGANLKLPGWLKEELFEEVLRKNVPGYKRITSFKADRGVAAGENYATIMLRVEIDAELENGKTSTKSFVMKICHDNELFKQMLKESNMFKHETGMFLDVVPEMEQLYREAGVKVKFGAHCYELDTPEYYVLLEDLRPQGFRNVPRLEGLDVEHTKCVLKKLALWHAASAVRVATKGIYDECYTVGFFKEAQKGVFSDFIQNMYKVLLECMEKYKGNEAYIDNIRKLKDRYIEKFFELNGSDESEFKVLNHGDCWSNNIMFKYDDSGKIAETYLVDYQIPRYGSPAQDLMYFIISSTQYDIKLKQFDNFIKYYHDNLIANLKLLKYTKKPPTLKDIHIALLKYGLWGYFTATSTLPIVLCDPTDKANIDNILGETDDGASFRMLMYSNERYVKHIEAILPWLNNRGALEV